MVPVNSEQYKQAIYKTTLLTYANIFMYTELFGHFPVDIDNMTYVLLDT